MSENVEKKMNYTSDKTLFDDKGSNPYQDPNQNNLLDQINQNKKGKWSIPITPTQWGTDFFTLGIIYICFMKIKILISV